MSVLDEILKKAAGAAGKYVSNVGNTWSGILGQDIRLGPGGSALGASLQNYGGQNTPSPFAFINPPKTYAAESETPSPDYNPTTPNSGPGFGDLMNTGIKTAGNTGDVLGATTTGDTPTGGDPTGQYYSQLNAILDRLGMMRGIAQRNIGEAGSVRDEVVGNIGTTYKNLAERANQSKESALANLGQENINTQNTYGRAEGTARRALESALTRNRVMARAGNRLNSSFYNDQQAGTTENFGRNIADTATEGAGKLAAIGTRATDTKNWFENKVTDLGQEEAQLKSQAERDYQAQVNAAGDMERSYGIDSLEAAQAAEGEYQSRLDQITNYIQNKALTLAQISATAGNQSGVIDAFKGITPELQTTLASQPAIQAGQQLVSGLQSQYGVGGSTTPDYTGFASMKEDPQTQYYNNLRRLGLLV